MTKLPSNLGEKMNEILSCIKGQQCKKEGVLPRVLQRSNIHGVGVDQAQKVLAVLCGCRGKGNKGRIHLVGPEYSAFAGSTSHRITGRNSYEKIGSSLEIENPEDIQHVGLSCSEHGEDPLVLLMRDTSYEVYRRLGEARWRTCDYEDALSYYGFQYNYPVDSETAYNAGRRGDRSVKPDYHTVGYEGVLPRVTYVVSTGHSKFESTFRLTQDDDIAVRENKCIIRRKYPKPA